MKVFTTIIRTFLIVGGIGILILFPIMVEMLENDAVFHILNVLVKVSVAMIAVGLFGGLIRALILVFQDKT